MSLTQMALSGSVLILCILAVRTLALRRLPKGLFLLLWEMAALRLLLPVAVPVPACPLPLPVLESPAALPLSAAPAALPSEPHLLPLLWAVGTAALALWFAAAYVKHRRVLQAGLPLSSQAGTNWLRAHPLCRPLELRVSDQIGSPLTYGILRPVILLPKGMPPASLESVLTHEYIHVRRFDALAKLVFTAALCLHWWNPLVWGMYVLADRDMELSCDAAVLRLLGEERRRDYAMTLLELEERRLVKLPLCSYFSEHIMKERIASIMKFQKTTSAALTAAVILTVSASAAFAAEQKTPSDLSPLPDGQTLDLSQLQSMELEDGCTLYALPGVDLETADPSVKAVTYTVSTDKPKEVSLESLPREAVETPTEEYVLRRLVSVKHSDQDRFRPKDWAGILQQIEAGNMTWED